MTSVLVECCNPSCPGREVKDGEVSREQWNATWLADDLAATFLKRPPEWASDVHCPSCGTEGIDPESGQLDSAEEELGTRCKFCGVVSHGGVFTSAHADPPTDAWGNRVPRECPHCNEPEAFTEDAA
jgi:hypothetical protein